MTIVSVRKDGREKLNMEKVHTFYPSFHNIYVSIYHRAKLSKKHYNKN